MVLTLEEINQIEHDYTIENMVFVIQKVYDKVNDEKLDIFDIKNVYTLCPSLEKLPLFFEFLNKYPRFNTLYMQLHMELEKGNPFICFEIVNYLDKEDFIKDYVRDNDKKSDVGKWLNIMNKRLKDGSLEPYKEFLNQTFQKAKDNYELYVKKQTSIERLIDVPKENFIEKQLNKGIKNFLLDILFGILHIMLFLIYNFFFILLKLSLVVLKSAIVPTIFIAILSAVLAATSSNHTFFDAFKLLSPAIPFGTFVMAIIKPAALLYALTPTIDPNPGFLSNSKEYEDEVSFKESILNGFFGKK